MVHNVAVNKVDPVAVKEAFDRDGYVHVRGVLDPDEAAAYRAECHELLGRMSGSTDGTWEVARHLDGGEAAAMVHHCHDVQLYSAAFARLLVDERFTALAAAAVGDNVRLHHTKVFVKPPERGAPFPLHQDHPYFPYVGHRVAAAIFHFDPAPAERGCVRVVPGSHRRGPLEHQRRGGAWNLPIDEWPIDAAVPLPAEPGDVVLFSYLTVHGSGVNRSDEARTTLLVQFHDAADVAVDDSNLALGRGMMLRGVAPSATARADLRV